MRGLYKRGSKWYCSIVDADGKLIRKPLSTDQKLAVAMLSEMRKNIELQKAGMLPKAGSTPPAMPPRELQGLIREYLDYCKALLRTAGFFESFDKAWANIFPRRNCKELQDCSRAHIDDWVRRRLGEGLKPQTINQRISSVRNFFRWATEKGHLQTDPLSGWKRLKPVDKNFRRDLTAEEGRRIIDAEEDLEFKLRWIVYFFTGLRRGAGLALCWDWIDWDAAILTLPAKHNKSRTSHRVPIHPELFSALQAWRSRDTSKTGPVFSPCPASTLLTRFRGACKKAGVDLRGVCLHSVRHTAAMRWFESSGYNIKVVKELLGHASVATTDIYLHASDHDKRQAVNGVVY